MIRDNVDVLVVDDGSADDTRAWLRARGVLVLSTNEAAPTVPKGLTAGWNVMVICVGFPSAFCVTSHPPAAFCSGSTFGRTQATTRRCSS